jgi:DNA-binding PadR family transcriptional regulator
LAFGRFGETAMWILVVLASGPMRAARLLDEVRRLDGHVGPGGLFAAVARLEQRGLIEPVMSSDGRGAYRLSGRGRADLPARTEGVQR